MVADYRTTKQIDCVTFSTDVATHYWPI